MMARWAVAAVVALGLAGCSNARGLPDFVDLPPEDPRIVEKLYNDAVDAYVGGYLKDALAAFDVVERQYGYTIWGSRAALMGARVRYLRGEYDATLLALRRYASLNPAAADINYVNWMAGMTSYVRIPEVTRDQRYSREARNVFAETARLDPDSDYSRAARVRIDLADDHLAGREMDIGRRYARAGEALSALGRFQEVVRARALSTHTPEALFRLVEIWSALRVEEEARRVAALLGWNYPRSIWYAKAWELLQDRGMLTPRESDAG